MTAKLSPEEIAQFPSDRVFQRERIPLTPPGSPPMKAKLSEQVISRFPQEKVHRVNTVVESTNLAVNDKQRLPVGELFLSFLFLQLFHSLGRMMD